MTVPRRVPEHHIVEVYPADDIGHHSIDTRGRCRCRPEIEEDGLDWIVIHQSFDGREDYETGKRRPH